RALGHYVFIIDMEGGIESQPVAQAVKCLACKLPWLKVLGSYPA
ncbi:MAG: prephenate dehydratase, partial [Actinobacteria bacterium]|nr:prephenate dehydratase [Actinomycetota bacterium]